MAKTQIVKHPLRTTFEYLDSTELGSQSIQRFFNFFGIDLTIPQKYSCAKL